MTTDLDVTSTAFRLRRKFAEVAAAPAVTRLTRGGHAAAVAGVVASQCVRLKQPASGVSRPLTALFLPKPGFTEDILASIGRDDRFGVIALDRSLVKAMATAFLPADVDDNFYRNVAGRYADQMSAYRAFCHELWPHLRRRLGIDLVLSGNFSYFAEQELIAALEVHGTPFVAMHKECLKTPGLAPFFEYTYSNRKLPFRGSAITVYNNIERDIQIAAQVAPPERITVTGMPRMDEIHRWRRAHAGRGTAGDATPRVLFMSFNAGTGAPKIQHKGDRGWEELAPEFEGVSFTDLVTGTHAAMVNLARDNPDIRVAIKTKNHATALKTIEQAFGKGFKPPANLEFVIGGDPFELIVGSDVMCAFNSTSLFEALAAGIPIVQPMFDEAADPARRPFVVELGAAADQATSADELNRMLAERARERASARIAAELPAMSCQMLGHWVGNSDGRAGQRTCDLLADIAVGAEAPAAASA